RALGRARLLRGTRTLAAGGGRPAARARHRRHRHPLHAVLRAGRAERAEHAGRDRPDAPRAPGAFLNQPPAPVATRRTSVSGSSGEARSSTCALSTETFTSGRSSPRPSKVRSRIVRARAALSPVAASYSY